MGSVSGGYSLIKVVSREKRKEMRNMKWNTKSHNDIQHKISPMPLFKQFLTLVFFHFSISDRLERLTVQYSLSRTFQHFIQFLIFN